MNNLKMGMDNVCFFLLSLFCKPALGNAKFCWFLICFSNPGWKSERVINKNLNRENTIWFCWLEMNANLMIQYSIIVRKLWILIVMSDSNLALFVASIFKDHIILNMQQAKISKLMSEVSNLRENTNKQFRLVACISTWIEWHTYYED